MSLSELFLNSTAKASGFNPITEDTLNKLKVLPLNFLLPTKTSKTSKSISKATNLTRELPTSLAHLRLTLMTQGLRIVSRDLLMSTTTKCRAWTTSTCKWVKVDWTLTALFTLLLTTRETKKWNLTLLNGHLKPHLFHLKCPVTRWSLPGQQLIKN